MVAIYGDRVRAYIIYIQDPVGTGHCFYFLFVVVTKVISFFTTDNGTRGRGNYRGGYRDLFGVLFRCVLPFL